MRFSVRRELNELPFDPKYGPASLLAHPFFGFDGFSRTAHLDGIRADIVKRQQWVLELQDGRNPEEVLALVMAESAEAEFLEEFMDDLDDCLPPRPSRKR